MNFQQYFSNNAARAYLAHPLQLLYKASLKIGEIPINLKLANITPICTCGSRNLPMHGLSSCSPYIKLNKNNGKNISKKFPPIPRNAPENECQATWLPLWQILPLPATGASQ